MRARLPTRLEERLQPVDGPRVDRADDLVEEGVPVERFGLAQPRGKEHPDAPAVDALEQGDVAQQEEAEVPGVGPRGQVEEDVIAALLVDADRQFLGKQAQRLAVLGLERDVRIPVARDIALHRLVEVAELVALGAEPVVLGVGQDRIQQHEPTNQPTHRCRLPMSVVGLPNRRVERLVLDVIHPPAPHRARRDRRGVALCDQAFDEVVALLAVGDVRELAVLPFEEHAGEQQDVGQEPGLSLGEAEGLDRLDPCWLEAHPEGRVGCAHGSMSSARWTLNFPPLRPEPPVL